MSFKLDAAARKDIQSFINNHKSKINEVSEQEMSAIEGCVEKFDLSILVHS